MFGGNLLSQVTIRLRLELIHGDADNASTVFMRTAAGGFHHSGVATGADGEACVREQLPNPMCFRVFRRSLAAFRATKDRHDSFCRPVHLCASPLTIKLPASR